MDAELEVWRSEWQSQDAVPLDLRKIVERQSRWMRIALAADILVTLGMGGGTLALAIRWPNPGFVVLAVATWTFIAAAWTFSLSVNRGAWAPAAVDTAAFVDLSLRRCRGRLAAVWFGAALYLVEIACCLGWIYRYSSERLPLWRWLFSGSITTDVVWLVTALLLLGLAWYRRKKRAEMAWLLDLRRAAGTERPAIR